MLEIRLLGQFSVTSNGQPVEISNHTGQVLLAYLALKPDKSHRRDQLARMVNEGVAEGEAAENLEQEIRSVSV